jgi:hypothetical protein
MNYIQKAKDYASMVAYSTSGDEYTFDETDLEYFLDSIGFDTINNKVAKTIADEELLQQALEVMEDLGIKEAEIVSAAIRARLAQDKENNGH